MIGPIVQPINDFTLNLLRVLHRPGEAQNLFFSPYSIHAALSMTLNGARHETLDEMKQALCVGRTGRQVINEAHAALRQALVNAGPEILLNTANAVWVQLDEELRERFKQRCEDYYGALAQEIDFLAPETLQTINGWVEQETNHKIRDLLKPPDLLMRPPLVLINAIYFKGLWQSPFKPDITRPAPFYLADGAQVQAQMMRSSGQYLYFENREVQVASLLYGDGQVCMDICLPARGSSLDALLARLDTGLWQSWIDDLYDTDIDLGLPRFRMESEFELSRALVDLGMRVAFTNEADFQEMLPGPLHIGLVRHKSFLEVNEEGSEAAAATAVAMLRASMFRKPQMVVNRPFLCVIRHRPSGAILFSGAVYDPRSE